MVNDLKCTGIKLWPTLYTNKMSAIYMIKLVETVWRLVTLLCAQWAMMN